MAAGFAAAFARDATVNGVSEPCRSHSSYEIRRPMVMARDLLTATPLDLWVITLKVV
jgi:hypothetical protein